MHWYQLLQINVSLILKYVQLYNYLKLLSIVKKIKNQSVSKFIRVTDCVFEFSQMINAPSGGQVLNIAVDSRSQIKGFVNCLLNNKANQYKLV